MADSGEGKLTSYQKRLFLFLSVATFFEGYDFFVLAQILPNIREDFGLSREAAGYLVGAINLGTLMAFWLVRKADVWGRRRVLTVTIVGYTIFTFISGFATNIYVFAVAQMLGRMFLLGEWAVSMVIAAEEFPAKKRGMVIGVIQAFSALGSIVCAGVMPILVRTEYGWRTAYLIAIVPLAILAFLRRGMKETQRFEEMQAARAERSEASHGQYREGAMPRTENTTQSLFAIWKTPYRKRVLILALIWFVAYVPSQNAITFWKEFALNERGMTDVDAAKAITIAAVVAMPVIFASGKFIDMVGRRIGAVVVFSIGGAGVVGCYMLEGFWPLTCSLIFGIFAASGYLPILNSYNTELFPTEHRAAAFAWANNVLGRISYVSGPIVVGLIAQEVGGFGPVVASTAACYIIVIFLVLGLLPETKGRELEDTASVT